MQRSPPHGVNRLPGAILASLLSLLKLRLQFPFRYLPAEELHLSPRVVAHHPCLSQDNARF